MPGDRFHYINGTIFCEHDRPGATLLNSHLPPLQGNSVLTDQKVNKVHGRTPCTSVSSILIKLCVNAGENGSCISFIMQQKVGLIEPFMFQ